MRSYGLGIAFCMVLAAIYAFQNTSEIIVRFIIWERAMPQGVWEIILFAVGAVAMWFISLSAVMEVRGRHSRLIKDQKESINIMETELKELRDERNSLIIALKKSGEYPYSEKKGVEPSLWGQDLKCYVLSDSEKQQSKESDQGEEVQEKGSIFPDQVDYNTEGSDYEDPFFTEDKKTEDDDETKMEDPV